MKTILQQIYSNRREQRGILALLILCFLSFGTGLYFQKFYESDQSLDSQSFHEVMALLDQDSIHVRESLLSDISNGRIENNRQSKLFSFDPNTVSYDELKLLGVPKYPSTNLIKFRKKGGKFYKNEDLKMIYGLSDSLYQRLEPYINISSQRRKSPNKPEKQANESIKYLRVFNFPFDPNIISKDSLQLLGLNSLVVHNITKYRANGGYFSKPEDLKKMYGLEDSVYLRIQNLIRCKPPVDTFHSDQKHLTIANKKPLKIDVNLATITELQQISGIGPVLSERIVSYREKLGGFHIIHQLKEVYNLQDSVWQKISSQLTLNPVIIPKNINTIEIDSLKSHPYISYKMARTIYNYRIQHGNYETIDDLMKTIVVTPELLDKIKPYFTTKPQ